MTRSAWLLLFFACASVPQSGIMTGHWTPKQGSAERVPFSWTAQDHAHGTMHATLGRGGEHFTGQYVAVREGAPHVEIHTVYEQWNAPAWGTLDWGEEGNYPTAEQVDVQGFAARFSGQVLATLFGNRDHSMRCKITLVDPQEGMVRGGVGHCQVSDGGQIDLEF